MLEQPLRRTYGILGFSWHCRERELSWRTERKPGERPSAIWYFEAVLQKRQQPRQRTAATPKAALGKPAFVRGVDVAQPARTFPPNPSRWRRSGFGWFRSLCGAVLSSSRNTAIMPTFRTNDGLSKLPEISETHGRDGLAPSFLLERFSALITANTCAGVCYIAWCSLRRAAGCRRRLASL